MVKFKSTHGDINIREIGKPVKKESDLMGSPAWAFRHTVKLTFNDNNTQFGYSTSISDFESGKIMMSDKDLHYSLSSFLEDGFYIEGSFEDFCEELGYEIWGEDTYDTDPSTGYNKKSLKVYNACKKLKLQAERIGMTEDIAFDIVEELREAGYE